MTDSAFKLVDDLTPWTISDFEILINSQGTIVATNPGQFYYHQRATNTSGATNSMAFKIEWPCQFMTQTAGTGQPIHAYVQLPSDGPNTWRDWTPQSSNITWNNTNASPLCDKKTGVPTPPGTGTITPNNVPAGAKVWVTVHLDYSLKDQQQPMSNFGSAPILYKPFQSTITTAGGSSFSSTSLLGRGKKVTVVYGRTSNKADGSPMAGVWMKLTQGSNYAWAKSEVDGSYVFYDGQGCSDGLEGCSGSLTSWTFGTGGNVATTLAAHGDGAAATATATYPGVKTGVTITSAGTTLATFASPTLPSYGFGVAKNSANARNWKFTP
jgi:hypothetical protein